MSRLSPSALSTVLVAVVAVLCLNVSSVSASTSGGSYAGHAFHATNTQRGNHHLRTLGHSSCLQSFAKKQAAVMARQHRMFHQALAPIQTKCKVGWVGENVAYGFSDGGAVVRAWMHSPEHRANILFGHYRLMGLAAVKGGGRWYVSQVFGRRV